jgi:hypothetical protein
MTVVPYSQVTGAILTAGRGFVLKIRAMPRLVGRSESTENGRG